MLEYTSSHCHPGTTNVHTYIHTCLSSGCDGTDASLMAICTEVPLVSCCCVYCNEYLFLFFFLHTITVQTRKAPLRKTKSREETIAATILPSNVDVVTPHEADDSTFNDDVFTGSVAKSQHSTNTHTYTHTILSYEHRQ